MDQSSALSSCAHDQAVAAATLTALDALKSKYNDLVALEDILWDGKGADHNVLLEIVSAKHTTTPSSSQVASAIEVSWSAGKLVLCADSVQNRHKILLSMLSEQITSAWVKSITVASQPSEPPQLSVKRRLKLALPHGKCICCPTYNSLHQCLVLLSRHIPCRLRGLHPSLRKNLSTVWMFLGFSLPVSRRFNPKSCTRSFTHSSITATGSLW